MEEEERRRAFEEESARIQAAERARAEEEARLVAREKERLDAPRRHAASLTDCGSAPRYYFDANGDFQELGKERSRLVCEEKPLRKRVEVTRDELVYGPDKGRLLEEGESELVSVTRLVWKTVVRKF